MQMNKMRKLRVLIVAVAAMVSFAASAQSDELNRLIEKYKNHPNVLYTEKRNPETKQVIKKEIIVTISGEKEVKELNNAVEKFIEKGDGVTDLTRTNKMLEVKAQTKDRRYSVMVTNKKEDTATLIYSEKPRDEEENNVYYIDNSNKIKAKEKAKKENK